MNIPNSQKPITPTVFRQTSDDDYRVATNKDQITGDWLFSCAGLTKREYFAGLAMAAMVNRDPAKSGWSDSESDQAIYIADSLLKQLEK